MNKNACIPALAFVVTAFPGPFLAFYSKYIVALSIFNVSNLSCLLMCLCSAVIIACFSIKQGSYKEALIARSARMCMSIGLILIFL